ncbi:(R)-mandelonitrile lyase 3-like [Pyrus ussuriensis x Pyrus communis]|uniref:(R)-mandelonitrile lyase n=1 Tax=Pyrus ussuriensis x Pyrus communis TaxID=2448454 RepID=A0A5N5FG43_9ROSA|nr:(R)-mandelonitrile lyase 3-like [Pyrus ussuriensis x Pyrus communis]
MNNKFLAIENKTSSSKWKEKKRISDFKNMKKSTIYSILSVLHIFALHPQSEVNSFATTRDHDFRYMRFVYNANDPRLEASYDYIVIGGGTAGCPLAATLSANYSVLLLERGSIPTAYPSVLRDDGFLTTLMREDNGKTPAQKFTSEDGVPNVRGRVLGGSSMINAGFYTRADRDFFMKSGIEWNMDSVYKAYRWVEETIVFRPTMDPWQSAVAKALLEAGVGPDNGLNLDHIKGTKIGGSTFDNNGRRHGAVELLNKGDPNKLRVAVHATVEKILFFSKASSLSAIGIMYSDSDGRSHCAYVRSQGEVVLSAGAIGSPQLLQLSGIGPESYLSSLKIPVVSPHPYVGQFMYDNPRNLINILPPFPLEPSPVKIVGITSDFYIESLSGSPFSTPPFSIFPNPFNPIKVDSSFGHIVIKVPGPMSYGSLRLQSSSDVRVNPKVKFNYYAHPLDLSRCVSGMKKIGELLRTNSLKQFKAQDLPGIEGFKFLGLSLPKNQTDDVSFQTFCRSSVATFWHYQGGSIVGKVVDSSLRVLGINALRVVDASTFNFSPGANPQATLMMFGRYVGLKMLQERSA